MFNLLFLFIVSVQAGAPAEQKNTFICEKTSITYYVMKQKNSFVAEICKNRFGQFVSKNCFEGCEFSKLIRNRDLISVNTNGFGSPGGQICRKLGLGSKIVEFQFKGSNIENIDLCFASDKKDSFVSTGFLFDLRNKVKVAH